MLSVLTNSSFLECYKTEPFWGSVFLRFYLFIAKDVTRGVSDGWGAPTGTIRCGGDGVFRLRGVSPTGGEPPQALSAVAGTGDWNGCFCPLRWGRGIGVGVFVH